MFDEAYFKFLKPEQRERQNLVVEKFREILYKKPSYERVVIDGYTIKQRRDDITLFYAQEAQAPAVLPLQREKKWTEIHAALRGDSPLIFTKEEDAKTTIEQLRDAIRVYGEPETIFYSRFDYDNSEGVDRNDSVSGAYFPFSEISEDLGL